MKKIFCNYNYIKPKNNDITAWNLVEYSEPYKINLQSNITYKIISEGKANAPIFFQENYCRSLTIIAIDITDDITTGHGHDSELQMMFNPDWNIEQIKEQFELR